MISIDDLLKQNTDIIQKGTFTNEDKASILANIEAAKSAEGLTEPKMIRLERSIEAFEVAKSAHAQTP